jgi:serine protease Do
MVVAIGNALGQFQNTVTSGIISGYGRSVQAQDETGSSVETLQNLFQTDAAINQGNSGGPLVNANGEVIGINTAVAGGAENVGFSIPTDDIKGAIKSVLETGSLKRPYLGVRYISLTEALAKEEGINTKNGALVATGRGGQPAIVPGSPAEKAGLKNKDVILKVNDQTIDATNSLTSVIGRYGVGDTVTLTILRDGKEITVPVKLEALPS